MINQRFPFPWFSALLLLGLCLYLYLLGNPDAARFYRLPELLFIWHVQISAIAVVLVVLMIDVRRFYRRQQRFLNDVSDMREEVKALKASKKQLQAKAHSYSSQTDKLKFFISDRLLEYIEYDEKFMHFKGIAAEVRHNGIICYDKLLTALQFARDSDSDNELYPEALTSLNYLWDLLDLSTADNIALHINNQLSECEEYFYQAQLQREKPRLQADTLAAETLPYTPTFSAHNAILRAIRPLMNETDTQAMQEQEERWCHGHPLTSFHYDLSKTCELLGNENHLVLVVENLVKNAQFYSARAKSDCSQAKKYQSLSIALSSTERHAKLAIYNQGPHIPAEIAEQIYQLGYTTRKAKEQHGRGLGLYFVKEIVNGYEGNIEHSNIDNQPDSYSVRIEFEGSGFAGPEVITEMVDIALDDEQRLCCHLQSEHQDEERSDSEHVEQRTVEWKRSRAIKSVEITARSSGQTHAYRDFPVNETTHVLDPDHPHIPRWAIEIQARKRSSKLTLIPLDNTGVLFNVTLPLAETQFEYDEEAVQVSDTYINGIEEKFRSIDG
ncbi:ATP-binding protein [Aestuariirhabdus sp. Z084]|uniref:ATP-binding protein n=1 Tax=Aestuariirhabdus haliotis TaxID=2918751 RepID=UPI00201B3DAB|nr:ATP-binding protein [Aestuariirhabdus haliotis]MCL6415739.1 ATP-binding protein [Aestuariirhabdus haliotis]MCL6419735.1 ATP-binding protein [Aestuariirhabdus haliotis]